MPYLLPDMRLRATVMRTRRELLGIPVSALVGAAVYVVARWMEQSVGVSVVLALLAASVVRLWFTVLHVSRQRGKSPTLAVAGARTIGGTMLAIWAVLVLSFFVVWNLLRLVTN